MINSYLRDNNLTKYQLAKKCNLPYGTLNDICNGKTAITKCTGETLMKIATALECTVDELLTKSLHLSEFNLNKIKQLIKPVAKKHQLKSVYIFGSYARGEANENSDVDILIDRTDSTIHGIFGMNALLNELKEVLGKDVDLVTVQSLNQTNTIRNNTKFIENVMKERIKIYG